MTFCYSYELIEPPDSLWGSYVDGNYTGITGQFHRKVSVTAYNDHDEEGIFKGIAGIEPYMFFFFFKNSVFVR